ncbi:hypothetical protein CRG98_041288 [Punica granatum]|uniref:Uncharacterized protein n=1 Tax=Punica granatum TaxID=22663 RepID=A0A2I0I3P3_PUNGR|nr:hypothetical protein CRG98_041288 [Punica granatum]
MEFLDPIKAAMEITRRQSAYERAWETRHFELSQSAKSGFSGLKFNSDALHARMGKHATASLMQGELDGFIKAAEIARDMNIQQFHLSSDAKDLIDII